MDTFFNNPVHSDLTIRLAGGNTLYAHKVILSAKSPVLSKMLSSPMVEATKGIIDFTSHNPEAVKLVIKSMYSRDFNCKDLKSVEHTCWLDLIRFAHYLEINGLLNLLSNMKSQELAISDILEAMITYGIKSLIRNLYHNFKFLHEDLSSFDELMNDIESLCTLGPSEYAIFRDNWLEFKFDQFLLFQLTCYYFERNKKAGWTILTDLRLNSLSGDQILFCYNDPLIKSLPLLHSLIGGALGVGRDLGAKVSTFYPERYRRITKNSEGKVVRR